jgi:hypothetical protein
MTSPEATVSPSCFNHFEMMPDSMVGDNASISIFSATFNPPVRKANPD